MAFVDAQLFSEAFLRFSFGLITVTARQFSGDGDHTCETPHLVAARKEEGMYRTITQAALSAALAANAPSPKRHKLPIRLPRQIGRQRRTPPHPIGCRSVISGHTLDASCQAIQSRRLPTILRPQTM